MLFNSFEFIFVFLPISFLGYFTLTRYKYYLASKAWLFLASLFFYSWWNPKYIVLLLVSIFVNYFVGRFISKESRKSVKKLTLLLGIAFNVGLLGYYKYADFFISNYNALFNSDFTLVHIVLPLGISFFTFQQIAFLVDSYKNVVTEYNFIYYGVFVSFFPQLIAGPIVHHKEMMPQFLDHSLARVNFDNIARGIFLFNMGLAKKIIVADTFGKIVNNGYANSSLLNTAEGWITSIAYSIQLYFDFSGYSDMAIGLGLLFNIQIPVNFWSPYKSANIQEFWRRWHITLSRFLRDYIYIPLGGNRKGEVRTYWNLFLTFLIGGFWHGANWTFVLWGALHGLALVVQRLFEKLKVKIPHLVGVAVTFLFVTIAWVFFRANQWSIAMEVLDSMMGRRDPNADFRLIASFYDSPIWLAGVILLFVPNTNQIMERFSTNLRFVIMLILLVILNLTFMNSALKQDFLYFDF